MTVSPVAVGILLPEYRGSRPVVHREARGQQAELGRLHPDDHRPGRRGGDGDLVPVEIALVPIMIGVVESSAEIVSCPLPSMYEEMSSALRSGTLLAPLASKESFWREL